MPARIIDVHTHAFPDAIAERAIAKLESECPWRACARGKVSELIASMDAAGVDVSVACAIATKPDQAAGILKWCGQIRSDRIEPFPSVHPDTPDAAGWVRRIADAGFRGIKLHPMYQEFAIDERRLDGIYAAAEECGLVIAFHCGRDIAFPPDDDRAEPRRLTDVLNRFPRLKVIATHLGGWRMWDQVEKHLLGRDVWMETSFALDEPAFAPAERGADLAGPAPARTDPGVASAAPEALSPKPDPAWAADLIRRHGLSKVLFGSDWPWARQDGQLALARGLGLTPAELDGILGANAAALLGLR